MAHKTRWITFWVTLVYWLGNAWGCANQTPIEVLLKNDPHEQPVAREVVSDESTPQTAPLPEARQHPAQGHTTASPLSETAPSLRGLDRSQWPRIVVGPANGNTPHGKLLFRDLPADLGTFRKVDPHYAEFDLEVIRLPAEDFSRVNENATVSQSQLLEALDDVQAQNWSVQNGKHLLLQPLKVSLDLLTVPFHSIDGAGMSDSATESAFTPTQFFEDFSPLESEDTPTNEPSDTPIDAPNDAPQDSIQQDQPQIVPDDTPRPDESPAPTK